MQEEYKDSHLFNSQNENISEIILPQDNNEIISEKLVDTFSIRLSQLEMSYKEKDSDISNLMYKLHSIILIGLDIKTKLPPVKVFGKKNFTPNDAEDNLNRSKISTISRRSISVSKAATRQFGKVEAKDKMAKFSQKAAINICSSQSQDSNINRTILSKSPNRENVQNNQQKQKVVQNKFNVKSNSLKVAESNNKRAINKSDDKQSKFISSNNIKSPLIHTNTYDAKKGKDTHNNEVNKPLRRKTNSDDLKTTNNNQKLNTSNNQITKTSTEISQVSKNHSGKYHSTSATSSSDIFVNNSNTTNKTVNYKFKPKKKLLGIIEKDPKFLKLFSTKNAQRIFSLVCKFCSFKEQFSLKNFSKNIRKMYFHNLISELTEKIKQVNKKQMLYLEMEIPKILESKINKENLYLSKYKETYRINNSFLNMINIIYLLTSAIDKVDWNTTLDEKITSIEEFTRNYDSNLNFYKALKEITHKIKTSNVIFESLMKNTNNIKFIFSGLSSVFTPLAEYLLILNKSFLNNCNNMEMKIDIEIIDHKIDILKTLSDNI